MPWTMTHGYKFTRESITRVPNQSGVLGLYNEEGWVFIESCSNLQEALSQYLDKSIWTRASSLSGRMNRTAIPTRSAMLSNPKKNATN